MQYESIKLRERGKKVKKKHEHGRSLPPIRKYFSNQNYYHTNKNNNNNNNFNNDNNNNNNNNNNNK